MGDVEISVEEDWTLKVVQHYNLYRSVARRPKGFDCHLVARWRDCRHFFLMDSLEQFLKVLFLTTVLLGVSRILVEVSTSHLFTSGWEYFHLGWAVVLLPAIAAVCVVGVFALKIQKNWFTPAPRREEVKTISGLIQHV